MLPLPPIPEGSRDGLVAACMDDLIYKDLTPQQRVVAESAALGLPRKQIAARASVTPTTVSKWLKLPSVEHYLQQLQKDTNDMISVTKPAIVNMLMEAISDAKLMSDPGTQIKGLREIGLMLGFYAPEEKRVTYTGDEAVVRARISEMSEKQLLEMAGSASNVIEGDFTNVSR